MYIYISAGLFLSTSVVQYVGVLWRNGNFRHGRTRALVTHAEGSVKIKVTLSRALKVEAGQYINLWIPFVSFSSFLQSHPFVITSWSHEEQNQLKLFVKARRGLTRELLYHAQASERGGAFGSRWVLFSGPHGISAQIVGGPQIGYVNLLSTGCEVGYTSMNLFAQKNATYIHSERYTSQ